MARSLPNPAPVRVRLIEFELDEANAWQLRSGNLVSLAPTPFNLLCAPVRQPGALHTKDALLGAARCDQFVTESVFKTAIKSITRSVRGDMRRAPPPDSDVAATAT